jgi:hypothetical protein
MTTSAAIMGMRRNMNYLLLIPRMPEKSRDNPLLLLLLL